MDLSFVQCLLGRGCVPGVPEFVSLEHAPCGHTARGVRTRGPDWRTEVTLGGNLFGTVFRGTKNAMVLCYGTIGLHFTEATLFFGINVNSNDDTQWHQYFLADNFIPGSEYLAEEHFSIEESGVRSG